MRTSLCYNGIWKIQGLISHAKHATIKTTMTKDQIKKEVDMWNGNLGTFEIYDRLREMLEYHWHRDAVDHKGEITREDVGKILSHAYDEWNTYDLFVDMATHLDCKFHGVEEAFTTDN